jgi:hypothetical protein
MQTNCNYFTVAKTLQKLYAKTFQKPHKNSTQKSFMEIKIFDKKIFFDFMDQALTLNKDIKFAKMNIITFSVMFPELKRQIKNDEDILINGIKIRLSKYCPQETVYFGEEDINID